MTDTPDPIDSYIAEVDRGLCGTHRERETILVEIRDGLLTAAEEHARGGLAPPAAATAATREFGTPSELAGALRPELAARHSRRIALTLLATGPIVGPLWAATAIASHLGRRLEHPHGLWIVGRVTLGLSIAAAIGAAALCLAATGRLTRIVNFPVTLAPAAAGASVALAALIDAAVLAALIGLALPAPTTIAWIPALAAATASSTRLALTTRAASRCLQLRRSVTR